MAGMRLPCCAAGALILLLVSVAQGGATPSLAFGAVGEPEHTARHAKLLQAAKRQMERIVVQSELSAGEAFTVGREQQRPVQCTVAAHAPRFADDDAGRRLGSAATTPADAVASVLDPLRRLCAEATRGWWTYQWCHELEVKQVRSAALPAQACAQALWAISGLSLIYELPQFHADSNRPAPSSITSLGKFVRRSAGTMTEEREEQGGVVVYLSHHFEVRLRRTAPWSANLGRFMTASPQGGDSCPETGRQRSAEVRFYCCNAHVQRAASLVGVSEPHICHYQLSVCTPHMCGLVAQTMRQAAGEAGGDGVSAGGAAASSAAHVVVQSLVPLIGQCYYKHAGWWSYELCLGQRVRQLHFTSEVARVSASAADIETEFVLGVHPRSQQSGGAAAGRPLHVSPPVIGHTAQGVPYLAEAYTGGTLCELSGQPRQVTVRYFCSRWRADAAGVGFSSGMVVDDFSADSSNSAPWDDGIADEGELAVMVEEVSELATCSYEMDVAVPQLCNAPGFLPRLQPTRVLSCAPTGAKLRHAAASDA